MAPYEALYGRKCRTPLHWDEDGEWKLNDVKLIEITSEKIKIIQERLKIAQDRQKSNTNTRRRDLEFEVGDIVFLKVAPWKLERSNPISEKRQVEPTVYRSIQDF